MSNVKQKIQCEHCKKEFYAVRLFSKYCSVVCYRKTNTFKHMNDLAFKKYN